MKQFEEDLAAEEVKILYTNWKGNTRWRTIWPMDLYFGTSEYHPHAQWLLYAIDMEDGEEKDFAMKDIKEWCTT